MRRTCSIASERRNPPPTTTKKTGFAHCRLRPDRIDCDQIEDVAIKPLHISARFIVVEGGYKKEPAVLPVHVVGEIRFIEVRLKTSVWCQLVTGKPRAAGTALAGSLKCFCALYWKAFRTAKDASILMHNCKRRRVTHRNVPILELQMPQLFKNKEDIDTEFIKFTVVNKGKLMTLPCCDVVLAWFWTWAIDEVNDFGCDLKGGGIECAQRVA
jgi:hypothetical protein